MATQSVEFGAPSGQTVTARLFSAGSDTVVQTASAVTEATNRDGVYTATFTDAAAGSYRLIATNSGGTLLAQWWVDLTLTTATFQSYEMPVSVVQSGLSTLDAAGVRTAVGMASANLDTQLADLPTVAEFEARTLVAAAYFDPAADTVANVTTVGSVTSGVTVTTNNDKTGYSLSSSGLNAVTAWTVDLTGNLTGNVTGSVGSVTSPVTAGTVTDKTGYSLSSSGLNAVTAWTVDLTGNLTGNVTGSVGSVTSPVTAGTVTDKTGYSLSTAGNTAVVDSLFARIPTKATQHTVERIFWNNDRTSTVDDGEVVANVANTAQSFETTLTGMANKYNDSLIQFTSGALEGESNSIASMDAAGVITFHDAFTAVPSAADDFIVRPESNHSPEEIAAAVELLLSTTTRAELASAPAANAPLADKLTWLAQLARNKMQSTALLQTLYADDETTVVATFAVSDDGTTATRGEAT